MGPKSHRTPVSAVRSIMVMLALALGAVALAPAGAAPVVTAGGDAARDVVDPPKPDDCGPRPQKATGAYWRCTMAEDFSGRRLNRKLWLPQTVFSSGHRWGPYACYRDAPANIRVRRGALHLTVRHEKDKFPCEVRFRQPTHYSAGMVSTYHRFSQKFGRFEARIRSTATDTQGLQEAFWLWPDVRDKASGAAGIFDTWPAAGEIDIAETYSKWPDLAVPFLHYTAVDNLGPQPGLNTAWDCAAARGEYNTYTLERSADQIQIFVNDKLCLTNTSGDRAFKKRYIVALTAMLGSGTNRANASTPLPARMDIDYVRVWR